MISIGNGFSWVKLKLLEGVLCFADSFAAGVPGMCPLMCSPFSKPFTFTFFIEEPRYFAAVRILKSNNKKPTPKIIYSTR